jgi:Protein of unknown function (DUF3348)
MRASFFDLKYTPMTRAPRRTHFHSARLVRTLVDLAVLKPGGADTEIAAKLGSWTAFTDAITLSRIHNTSMREPKGNTQRTDTSAIVQEVFRVRAALEHSITSYNAPGESKPRIALPMPLPDTSIEEASLYTPYRRYHQNHQRNLEQSVRGLRNKVRNTVAKASPKLRQLAMLDASYEGILQEREASLLGTIPSLFERHFHQLRKAHLQRMAESQQTDSPLLWMTPDAWLNRFLQNLHAALLDELDLRLQPTLGLLEAFTTENT